ncbi:MAG: DNRLRE domain-containing protein, partial [Clostridia bacterium]|nr:DNRLRE domain-containing protein [Clostridia bacterium]
MTKTKTNVVMRAIAFLLSLLMTFYAIPSVIYAEFGDALSSLSSDSASDSDKSTSLDVPIYEAENLREENVKTFCLPDGSYVAAVYPTAVHRQDENGVWQDIDNSLSASGSEYVSGDARVKFAKKISGNGTLFTLHENNTKITFSLIGAIKKTPGEVVKVEVEDDGTELGKKMTLANLNSTIIYRDVLDGIDVEYVLSSNDIKENIIVKEKAEEYTYSFTLKLNNLTATLTESGDVLIMNGEEVAYEIPAPVIYDANGTYADTGVGVYTLTDNGGGSYTLTVVANSEWMNSADRAFPVTVDPTLEAKRSAFFITYVDSNDSEGAVFDPREIPLIPNQTELFVKINNLDFLPRKAYITNAEISFYSGVVWDRCIAAYRIIESWDNSITYTDKPEYSENMLTYNTSPTYDLARSYFDITEAVKDWWASSSQNYGIVIKATESCLGNITLSGFRTDNVPSFTVSYRNLYGLEDYLAYSSHSIGAGASGHVNLATGNLTLAIPTLATTDSLMSFIPTLYYNSSMLGKYNRYMHAEVPYAYHAVGVGFKWNMQQSVIKKNNSNASAATAQYYVWADGDGTEHVLHKVEYEDGSIRFLDEDGLQIIGEENGGNTFTITDRNGTVMLFSPTDVPAKAEDIEAAWTLTSITDKIGNKLIFEYDSRWRPTKVYVQPNGVAPIKMLEITYSGNALKEITNSITGDKVVFKNSMEYNGEITESGYTYLREIEWIKGGEVVSELQFDYNYEGLILGVTEAVSNYSIDYG